MTTSVRASVVIVTSHNFAWSAHFDDYDGAPDAGHQCVGHGSLYPGAENTEIAAVRDLYDDYDAWFEQPLCAHRPMFKEDLE